MSSPKPTITFAFNVLKLNVLPSLVIHDTLLINDTTLTNVVTSVIYQYIGTSSNGQTCVITGECPLAKPNLDNYKDYHELTETEVVTWLESSVNVQKFQADITDYLNGNNVISLPLPWISS